MAMFGLDQMWGQAFSPQSMNAMSVGMGNVGRSAPQAGNDGFWDNFWTYLNAGGSESIGDFIDYAGQYTAPNRPVVGGQHLAPVPGRAATTNPGMLLLSRLAGLGALGGGGGY